MSDKIIFGLFRKDKLKQFIEFRKFFEVFKCHLNTSNNFQQT